MTVHGTARFAKREEMSEAGLLTGFRGDGLLVGMNVISEDDAQFEPIRYSGDLHQLIVAGTGGGKFTSAIAPMLMGSHLEDQTVVVVDPKGEIAQLVGPVFARPYSEKANVHLLDPWDQCGTGMSESLNVLSTIVPDNPNHVDDARALADAIIIPSGGENTHWDNTARNFLTAVILYVALDPLEKDRRDLVRVRDLVTLPWAMPKSYTGPKRETLQALLYGNLENDVASGAVRNGFRSLINREEKERSGILSSIDRDTAWIDSPQMRKVISGNDIDPVAAGTNGHKYFIIVPPDYFMTHRSWVRLVVTAFARGFKRNRPPADLPADRRWRHIVIDEFANLGEMAFILNDIAVARGYDIKYHFAIQDLAQLERVYELGWQSFISNTFQRFFAVSDLHTAEYVSRMLGTATVESTSFGTSKTRGKSQTFTDSMTEGASMRDSEESKSEGFSKSSTEAFNTGSSESTTINQVQRPLMTPDEVRRLGKYDQLLFIRGLHPIGCGSVPYWFWFEQLPKHSLGFLLSTVGKPPDEDVMDVFTGWMRGPWFRFPDAPRRPVELPTLPAPVAPPALQPDWLLKNVWFQTGLVPVLLIFFVYLPPMDGWETAKAMFLGWVGLATGYMLLGWTISLPVWLWFVLSKRRKMKREKT